MIKCHPSARFWTLQYSPACQTPSLQTFSFCWHFIREHFENSSVLKNMHFETWSLWITFHDSLLVLDIKFILHLLSLVLYTRVTQKPLMTIQWASPSLPSLLSSCILMTRLNSGLQDLQNPFLCKAVAYNF